MNLLKKVFVGVGIAAVGLNLAYRYLLSDEQRSELRKVQEEMSNAAQEVSEAVSPLVSDGPTPSEERAAAEANRARTEEQWAAIGFGA